MCQYVRMRDVFIKKVWYPFGVQCCGVERGDNHVTKVWMSVRMFLFFFFVFLFVFFLSLLVIWVGIVCLDLPIYLC